MVPFWGPAITNHNKQQYNFIKFVLFEYYFIWSIDLLDSADLQACRWLLALSTPLVIAFHGVKKQSLDFSGAISGKLSV